TGLNQTIVSLAPGAVETLTTTYTITQADLDNGSVLNTATATGEDPDGDPVDPEDPTDGEVETPGTQNPGLTITKSARDGDYAAVGDVITYEITVRNTGNVTLSNIVITDSNADTGSIIPSAIASLA